MSTDKKDEIKQLIIQMLLVNDEMNFYSIYKFFDNGTTAVLVLRSLYELERDNIISYISKSNFVYLIDK